MQFEQSHVIAQADFVRPAQDGFLDRSGSRHRRILHFHEHVMKPSIPAFDGGHQDFDHPSVKNNTGHRLQVSGWDSAGYSSIKPRGMPSHGSPRSAVGGEN
jgi:hypothetical protein